MRKRYTSVSIPVDLYRDIQKLIEKTSFTSVSEFVKHILRDIAASGEIGGESRLTAHEIELVRRRLRSLGYL